MDRLFEGAAAFLLTVAFFVGFGLVCVASYEVSHVVLGNFYRGGDLRIATFGSSVVLVISSAVAFIVIASGWENE